MNFEQNPFPHETLTYYHDNIVVDITPILMEKGRETPLSMKRKKMKNNQLQRISVQNTNTHPI